MVAEGNRSLFSKQRGISCTCEQKLLKSPICSRVQLVVSRTDRFPTLIRPGSYVAFTFLPCRIKFDVGIGCRISAECLTALSDRNLTPIYTSNFSRVDSNTYILVTLLSMRKFGLAK